MNLSLPIHRVKVRIDAYLSHCATNNLLAVIILVLASTQLGLHFWPSSSYIYGLRIDYLSPTLYLLDLLIILYLLFFGRIPRFILLLSPIFLVNIIFSLNPLASIAWVLRFCLFSAFVTSLTSPFIRSFLPRLLLFSAAFQITLGTIQVWLGHAVQGPLYWLGERQLNVGSPNVAKAEYFGQMVLRAYGTFSHPNVLAGWLVIALLIVIHLASQTAAPTRSSNERSGVIPNASKLREDSRTLLKRKSWMQARDASSPAGEMRVLIGIATLLATFGILLTQSRSAALSLFFFVIPFSLLHAFRTRILYFVFILFTVYGIRHTFPLLRSPFSFSERVSLQNISLQSISQHPLFGTGANASLSAYPLLAPNFRLLQPDHNSFTLFLSWFGLVGLMVILYQLKTENWKLKNLLPFIPLLPLLLIDHYFLTSPQGLLIFLVYLRSRLS